MSIFIFEWLILRHAFIYRINLYDLHKISVMQTCTVVCIIIIIAQATCVIKKHNILCVSELAGTNEWPEYVHGLSEHEVQDAGGVR